MDKKISASEINKYLYCPYQWYYEKIYGRKQLIELKGSSGGEHTAFQKGKQYHDNYHKKYNVIQTLIKFTILAVVIIGVCIWIYLR